MSHSQTSTDVRLKGVKEKKIFSFAFHPVGDGQASRADTFLNKCTCLSTHESAFSQSVLSADKITINTKLRPRKQKGGNISNAFFPFGHIVM